jgi:thioredoxin reductase
VADRYDVVVVGGGAAGLAGAVGLARARRSVLLIDSGQPRNAPAGRVHNYLAREGTSPAELFAAGRGEVIGYGGRFLAGRVTAVSRSDGGFAVALDGGDRVHARRLLVTTGLVDELPDVPGVAARWGRDVLHCPHCHGWEVRDRRIGVLATGPTGVQQAHTWRQWTSDLLLLLHGTAAPDAEAAEQLAVRGIAVVAGPVAELVVTDDTLTGARLGSGEVVPLDALVVTPRFTARADVLATLGLMPVEVQINGYTVGSQVPADPTGATAIPGVWVAGNVTHILAQVVTAAATGLNAAIAINADLTGEDTRSAVNAHRHRLRATLEHDA